MAKKKRLGKGSSFLSDETASTASTSTLGSVYDLHSPVLAEEKLAEEELAPPFERCLEALYEKRATTRIAALSELVSLLEREYCWEECSSRHVSMERMMLSCLRKGTSTEASLAIKALGLHLLTLGLGPEMESAMPEVSIALQKIAAAESKDATLRSFALEVLALLTFAAVQDQYENDEIMTGLLRLSKSSSPKTSTAALKGWTLLLTTLGGSKLTAEFCEAAFQAISPLLSVRDVELRAAAGEAIAAIFQCAGMAGMPDEKLDQGYDEDSDTDEDTAHQGLSDVVARMRELATNRADPQRRSKKDRSYLKSHFREHCKAVEGGKLSFERLKFSRGRVLVIDNLEGQIQLNAFRHFLGTGLQPQLEGNSLLQDIFGLSSDANGGSIEALESGSKTRRTPSTATLKSRSKGRSRQQKHKAANNGSLLGALHDDGF